MKKIPIRAAAMLLLIYILPHSALAARMLVPVGQVVGLELSSNTVTVAAFAEDSRAEAAGVRVGDRIVSVDERPITCTQDIRTALARSDGSVELVVSREGKEITLSVQPDCSQDGPRLGIYLRQGITGIGTVTYYDPESGSFGALGHGVTDSTGGLLKMQSGSAYPAKVTSVRRGVAGEPGQLMGALAGHEAAGQLQRNCAQGVFGKALTPFSGAALPTAEADQVHPGKATILSTVQGSTVREYSVEILKIYPEGRKNGRNLLLKVNDEALLETTGGIVQGMSGSPLVQDGKLIGAVTHVLVNDPTMGYGIFIENMLEAAG